MTPNAVSATAAVVDEPRLTMDAAWDDGWDELAAELGITSTWGHVTQLAAEHLPEARKRLAKLNAKAADLGAAPLTLLVGPAYEVPIVDHDIDPEGEVVGYERRHLVAVAGEAPALGGWKLAARIDHQLDAADVDGNPLPNVIRSVPGVELATEVREAYRTVGPDCAHCGLSRVRRDTFLVIHEDGEIAQVGSSCIADFLGHHPGQVFSWASYVESFVDWAETEGGMSAEVRVGLHDLLTATVAVAETTGWVSRGKVYESGWGTATADTASELISYRASKYTRELRAEYGWGEFSDPDVEAARKATASEIIAWVRGLDTAEVARSDYLSNLVAATAGESVGVRSIGIAASAYIAWMKATERLAQRKAEAEAAAASEWVGEVKERLRGVVATVISTHRHDGDYGVSALYKLVTPEGNVFTTWTSGGSKADDALDLGVTARFDGTVKEHSEFRGAKETALSRVTVKEAWREDSAGSETETEEGQ